MKKLLFTLIFATFIFVACKKGHEENEPAIPAAAEEAQSMIAGKWKLVKGVSKYSSGPDTVYTRIWDDSLYQEFNDHYFREYVILDGEEKQRYHLPFSVSDYPMESINNNYSYKYYVSLSFRQGFYHRNILKLTKTTLLTMHLETVIYSVPGVNADRETIIFELERVQGNKGNSAYRALLPFIKLQ